MAEVTGKRKLHVLITLKYTALIEILANISKIKCYGRCITRKLNI
jgi:hypothetical protein